MIHLHDKTFEPFISSEEIEFAIKNMAKQMDDDFFDEVPIFIGVLNRDQNHLKFNKYNASTGEFIKTLFEEKATTWVEPQHAITFVPNNPTQFIYQTDFNGFNQMYLYNTDGKLIKNLGSAAVVVTKFIRFRCIEFKNQLYRNN